MKAAQKGRRRVHFHLRGEHQAIPDTAGFEVDNLAQAATAALEFIKDIRETDPSVTQDWSGWTLDIADPGGTVLVSINLGGVVEWASGNGVLFSLMLVPEGCKL